MNTQYYVTLRELEKYVAQNSSRRILREREILMALKALECQTFRWPSTHILPVGAQSFCCYFRQEYNATTPVHYETCLKIQHKDKKVVQDGDLIGLTEDFELTPPLAKFLAMNQDLIFQDQESSKHDFCSSTASFAGISA
ncbi:hypothetical protein FB446DRAFT_826666 [Lentinula raphanica]|nr:hypothetical protein FB446DRAFT_826666 [Lentinula raphanica]